MENFHLLYKGQIILSQKKMSESVKVKQNIIDIQTYKIK